MPKACTSDILVHIWQRVLHRSSVGENDNFFDLDGTPSSATRLFAEISKAFGRDLSPVLIYLASTIENLSALLDDPTLPRIPPLLLLKAGTAHPPIFMAHGVDGNVLGFSDLVGKIESGHPIYGMQARGIDGVGEPFTSIEERAEFHLEAIRQVQIRGPYLLIGYSLGGFVALEIARRLLVAGEKVALLALVDSYPEKSHLPPLQRMFLSLRQGKRRVGSIIESSLARTRVKSTEISNRYGFQREQFDRSTDTVLQRMRDADYLALRRYDPQFYPGKIKFVKAGISTCFPDNPTAVWAHLAEELEVETAPGDHVGMITTHCRNLGAILSVYVRESTASGTAPPLKLTA